MSFGKFGSRPRGMSNPIYWVNRHLQDQRRQEAKINSVNKFNEKWQRLNAIFDNLRENFIVPLNGLSVTTLENQRLYSCLESAINMKSEISNRINDSSIGDLSKYATSLKRLILISFSLCKKLSIYSDIKSIEYDSKSKTILLNGEVIYYLG